MRAAKSILMSLLLAAGALPSMGLEWQQHKSQNPPPRSTPPINSPSLSLQAHSQNSSGGPQLHLNGPGPHKGDWLRQYMTLPPGDQEQKLKQDPSFRNLDSEKQQKLLDRLRNFNSLSPDKRAKILNRMETYEHMTPSQQAAANNLFQRYRSLPDDQRGKVSQAYRQMMNLPPDQREQFLNSDDARRNFSDDERDLLRGMADLNLSPSRD